QEPSVHVRQQFCLLLETIPQSFGLLALAHDPYALPLNSQYRLGGNQLVAFASGSRSEVYHGIAAQILVDGRPRHPPTIRKVTDRKKLRHGAYRCHFPAVCRYAPLDWESGTFDTAITFRPTGCDT